MAELCHITSFMEARACGNGVSQRRRTCARSPSRGCLQSQYAQAVPCKHTQCPFPILNSQFSGRELKQTELRNRAQRPRNGRMRTPGHSDYAMLHFKTLVWPKKLLHHDFGMKAITPCGCPSEIRSRPYPQWQIRLTPSQKCRE